MEVGLTLVVVLVVVTRVVLTETLLVVMTEMLVVMTEVLLVTLEEVRLEVLTRVELKLLLELDTVGGPKAERSTFALIVTPFVLPPAEKSRTSIPVSRGNI